MVKSLPNPSDSQDRNLYEKQFGDKNSSKISKKLTKIKKIKKLVESLKIVETRQEDSDQDLKDSREDLDENDAKILTTNEKLLAGYKKLKTTTTVLQQQLYRGLSNYQDLFYFNETHESEEELRHLIAIHSLNHVYKSRDIVVSNSLTIKKDTTGPDVEYRDQGFTRPTVLILLPFKNDAYLLINDILTISGCSVIENQDRFEEEFFIDDEPNPRKPADYNHTFKGNNDDCFKIGLKFSRKKCKLYSNFYSSDILICSPLGLEMIIGNCGL